MKNEWKKSGTTLGQPMWMVAGGQVSSVRNPVLPSRRKFSEPPRLRLANRTENDLASGIAYLVLAGSLFVSLAGSLFVSLVEFFASLPG